MALSKRFLRLTLPSAVLLSFAAGYQHPAFAATTSGTSRLLNQKPILNSSLSLNGAFKEKTWNDYIKVSVESDSLYNSAHPGLDSRASRLNIKSENKNLKALLDDMGIESYAGVETIFGFSVSISGVPTLVKGMTETELHQAVDEKLYQAQDQIDSKIASAHVQVQQGQKEGFAKLDAAITQAQSLVDSAVSEKTGQLNSYFSSAAVLQQKSEATQALRMQLENQITNDPNFALLSTQEQQAMLQKADTMATKAIDKHFSDQYNSKLQLINDTAAAKKAEIASVKAAKTAEILGKVKAANQLIKQKEVYYKSLAIIKANEAKKTLDQRVDQIQLDTTFQEVAFVIGRDILNGRALVFAHGGKITPDIGGRNNQRGFNQLDSVRPQNTYTTGGMGAAATGGVQFGTNFIMAKGKKLQIDIASFHDRPNFYSGSSYVSNVATMTEQEYEQYKDWYVINSVVGRMLFYSDTLEVYGAFGSYNGKQQGQVGIDLKLNEDLSIHAAFTKGERKNLKQGLSTFVVYRPLQRIKLYTGLEFLNGLQDPIHSARINGSVDRSYSATGAQLVILDKETLFNGTLKDVNVTFSAEFQKTITAEGYVENSLPDNDFVIGGGVNAHL